MKKAKNNYFSNLIKKLNESIIRQMDMIKSTTRGPAVCENVLHGFYVFYLGIAQAMNRLIAVFVSREEWSTATEVIESDCKAANLISISLVQSSNFWCRLYHRASKFSVNCGH